MEWREKGGARPATHLTATPKGERSKMHVDEEARPVVRDVEGVITRPARAETSSRIDESRKTRCMAAVCSPYACSVFV